jgi:copper chaperone NosL
MIKRWLFKGELTRTSQALAIGAALCMVGAIFLPLWRMTMISNQYPDGLIMWIYSSKIQGDLQEINILNHYIGMHPLDANHFVELRVLPYVFGLGALACLAAALLRRRLFTTLALLGGIAAGLGSMSVLFYELYNYGHDLDPRAPIDVDPFMPPPMGSSQLANFHVTTILHAGSILFILALLGLMAALWLSRPRPAVAPAQAAASRPATGNL